MDKPTYTKGQRVAVIINRTNAEAANIPFVVTSGVIDEPARADRTWVFVNYMHERPVRQMVAAEDIVGHTLQQPDGVNLPAAPIPLRKASNVPGVIDAPGTD